MRTICFFVYTTFIMMHNITLTADKRLIDLARTKALAEQTTLNVEFRKWLAAYAATKDEAAVARFRGLMTQLAHVDAGQKFTRDEMNER
jgi:hypothetical protein